MNARLVALRPFNRAELQYLRALETMQKVPRGGPQAQAAAYLAAELLTEIEPERTTALAEAVSASHVPTVEERLAALEARVAALEAAR